MYSSRSGLVKKTKAVHAKPPRRKVKPRNTVFFESLCVLASLRELLSQGQSVMSTLVAIFLETDLPRLAHVGLNENMAPCVFVSPNCWRLTTMPTVKPPPEIPCRQSGVAQHFRAADSDGCPSENRHRPVAHVSRRLLLDGAKERGRGPSGVCSFRKREKSPFRRLIVLRIPVFA